MAPEINNVKYEEEFIFNSRNVKLFTCSWIPKNKEPKALIFICHGYAMECSISMNSTAVRLVNEGYACYGIDYQGHGKSDGLSGLVNNFDDLVDDCFCHFTRICEKEENKKKMRYLLGESMGGTMALLLHRKKPDYFDGAVLVAPMCKIAENVKPHPLVISVLTKLCKFIPTWKIIPGQDIIDVAFKEPEIREKVRANKYCYKGRPRLKTGYELLRVSMDLEQKLDKADDRTENVRYEEEFIENPRGLKLFTCRWLPMNEEPKALIFICHGYAMECSITMDSTATRLANVGYAVYGIDCEGHGKSDGLEAYVENFDNLVDDSCSHFTSISERKENKGKMRYLLGESMGGAMALLLQRKKPDFWNGAILVAPMCKIADEMKPHPLMISIVSILCQWLPKWKALKGQDIIDLAFKEPAVREQIRANKYCYKGPPRMKTAHELYRISLDLEQRLSEVSIPFIVLHGEDDKVTDKAVSEQLFNVASSSDKTLKLYKGMWHGLLYGEPEKNIEIVFKDIVNWLDERATAMGFSRLEMEQKYSNDDLVKCEVK